MNVKSINYERYLRDKRENQQDYQKKITIELTSCG